MNGLREFDSHHSTKICLTFKIITMLKLINKELNLWQYPDGKVSNSIRVIDEMVYDTEVGKWIHIDEYGDNIFPIPL